MNITKKKWTQRYREQTSGYQREMSEQRAKRNEGNKEVQITRYKINKLQGCNVQHRVYIQYFIMTLYKI